MNKWLQALLDLITKKPTPPIVVNEDWQKLMLQYHNNTRKNNGSQELSINEKLTQAAQQHAQWMRDNNTLTHMQDNLSVGDRVLKQNYRWKTVGENIAKVSSINQQNPEFVFKMWLNSSGHKRNIINNSFQEVGFGKSGNYFVTVFAAKR